MSLTVEMEGNYKDICDLNFIELIHKAMVPKVFNKCTITHTGLFEDKTWNKADKAHNEDQKFWKEVTDIIITVKGDSTPKSNLYLDEICYKILSLSKQDCFPKLSMLTLKVGKYERITFGNRCQQLNTEDGALEKQKLWRNHFSIDLGENTGNIHIKHNAQIPFVIPHIAGFTDLPWFLLKVIGYASVDASVFWLHEPVTKEEWANFKEYYKALDSKNQPFRNQPAKLNMMCVIFRADIHCPRFTPAYESHVMEAVGILRMVHKNLANVTEKQLKNHTDNPDSEFIAAPFAHLVAVCYRLSRVLSGRKYESQKMFTRLKQTQAQLVRIFKRVYLSGSGLRLSKR